MSYLYKCNGMTKGVRCGARRALPRKVEDYIRKPKCLSCGKLLTYLDTWQKKKNKETTCHCDGLPYPHRKGSDVWCKEHPTGPTEEDQQMRYG